MLEMVKQKLMNSILSFPCETEKKNLAFGTRRCRVIMSEKKKRFLLYDGGYVSPLSYLNGYVP